MLSEATVQDDIDDEYGDAVVKMPIEVLALTIAT
jgi:hypothetical protein